jgi:hypothetical protein
LIANGLQTTSWTNAHCKQSSQALDVQEKGRWILQWRHTL